LISLVVPAYNERQNIPSLVERAGRALQACGSTYELIIVDDNSPMGPPTKCAVCRKAGLGSNYWCGKTRRPLHSGDRWLAIAQGDILGCMDADLQHPPELLPVLHARAEKTGADLVIGSRHVAGGGVSDWSFPSPFRVLVGNSNGNVHPSGDAGQGQRPDVGFFLLRRAVLDHATLRPLGLQDPVGSAGARRLLAREEVPFIFDERSHGSSKMGAAIMKKYMRHLLRISIDTGEAARMFKFALVGLSGVAVNYLAYRQAAQEMAWNLLAADFAELAWPQ